jgi:hypothetical protein
MFLKEYEALSWPLFLNVMILFINLTCCLFTVMVRLNLATRNMIKKRKNLVLMFWIDMFSTIVVFFDLLCVLVEDHIHQKSLRATYFIDFYSRQ